MRLRDFAEHLASTGRRHGRHLAGLLWRVETDKTDREQLARLLNQLAGGDVPMMTRLDPLARSTRDLLNTPAVIAERKSGFGSLADIARVLRFAERPGTNADQAASSDRPVR